MYLLLPVRSSILVLALLLAVPYSARAQMEPEEHTVYRAVLARFIKPETRRIVLSDSTRTVRADRYDVERLRKWGAPDKVLEEFNQWNAFVTDELLESFNQRNTERIALPNSLDLPVPVELLSAAEFRALQQGMDQDGWDWLRRRLPGSPGVVSLSRVGFSPEGDRALIWVFLDCGSRCGSGSWVLLHRRDGEWQVEHWITTLRS